MRVLFVEFDTMTTVRDMPACTLLGLSNTWCENNQVQLNKLRTRLYALNLPIPSTYDIPSLDNLSSQLSANVVFATDKIVNTEVMVCLDIAILIAVLIIVHLAVFFLMEEPQSQKQ